MNFILISFLDSSSIKSDIEQNIHLEELWGFWKELVKVNNMLLFSDNQEGGYTIRLSEKRFREIVQLQARDELLEIQNGEIIRRHKI